MSNSTSILLSAWEGKIVPRSFAAGYVVLSYLVSFVGAWTTLEVINKRTAGRGSYNWFLLIGSSISMGGIAIWGMHYVGNRAIVLGSGEDLVQIEYNPGFTALSFFVPILVLLAAFMAVGSNDSVSWIRVGTGGFLAGLAICGMHYLGQAGISNYTSVYNVAHIIGSAVIAIIASITALAVFFILRASWTNSLWRRAATAVILAGAVSGMHWLASVGTQYRLKRYQGPILSSLPDNSTVIVVIILSIAACFILLALSLIAQRRRARSANRAQQVVLAAGIFDSEGRLMVTADGELPTRKITTEYIERSFDDVFGISHPTFLWIFRTTRNWTAISSLIPSMRNHIQQTSVTKGSRPGTKSAEVSFTNTDGDPVEDYSIIFRELFCIAASDLAAQMGEPLEKVGVLYDEILSTGRRPATRTTELQKNPRADHLDMESAGVGAQTLGRGQLLFLVRRLNRRESEQLASRGYRFAAISNVANILSNSMQISSTDLVPQLEGMREKSAVNSILAPGVHMACFSVRASVKGGFDVLVRRDAGNQLPTMQLPIGKLDAWHLDFLSEFEGISVARCLQVWATKSVASSHSRKEQIFAAQLHATLEALRDEINDAYFNDAQLVARPVLAPCQGLDEDASPEQATLIAFRIIVPIHSRAPALKLQFTPLSFFKAQQYVYRNSPDHAVFARKIHREFGPILNRTSSRTADLKSPTGSHLSLSRDSDGDSGKHIRTSLQHVLPPIRPKYSTRRPLRAWLRMRNDHESDGTELKVHQNSFDTSSERNLVEKYSFGGIMVSQEVNINVRGVGRTSQEFGDENDSPKHGSNLRMGTTGIATKEDEDPETYVDRLFAACVASR